jgi:hypothetical protein
MYNKILNSFPILGSISLPLLTIHLSNIIEGFLIGLVGALGGIVAKRLWHYVERKYFTSKLQ